jgi:hypothetical protein
MSLLTTASVWTTDDIPKTDTIPKKKNTTIRRNRYENIHQGEPVNYNQHYSMKNVQSGDEYIQPSVLTTLQPENINQHIENNEKREMRINEILNKMDEATDGDMNVNSSKRRLNDFNPPPKPQSFAKHDNISILGNSSSDDRNYSNYQTTYLPTTSVTQEPYYTKMSLKNGLDDNKIMDKINYMIHMLEEQQNEKTANVTEEFILYTFLGVFIIFISDSFARSGKYTR